MNRKGFTLVEILATITLLGILTVMGIVGYTRYVDYAKNKSYKFMAKSIATAAEEQTTATSEISTNMQGITSESQNLGDQVRTAQGTVNEAVENMNRLHQVVEHFKV